MLLTSSEINFRFIQMIFFSVYEMNSLIFLDFFRIFLQFLNSLSRNLKSPGNLLKVMWNLGIKANPKFAKFDPSRNLKKKNHMTKKNVSEFFLN